jgi:DNA polymerase III subunit gamma/tau
VAKRSGSAELDLGSWQKKLSGFAANPDLRESRSKKVPQTASADGTGTLQPIANIDALRVEWRQFLDHLARKSHNFMTTHLQSCELAACTPDGVVEIACCRKFSYEELQQDRELLQKELSEFYALPLQLRIGYDAQKDACTREKSVFTLFQELSQKNEVIRYLITEFGGELVY